INDRRGEAFCLHDIGALHLAQNRPHEAVRHLRTACQIRQELGETGNYLASRATLGDAALAAGDTPAAARYLKEAVDLLRAGHSSGEYPLQEVWWAYARLCRAQEKPGRADEALGEARLLIQAKAEQIKDPALKQSYMQNVRVNAAIMAEVAAAEN
ncbi:MAG: tetratricopeptide repeat protein, partial [Anaerolineae bacterium]